MYVCGVTVYDHSHLGHARSACAFDAIARHLRSKVERLVFARNITDIDDKILNRAKERGLDWRALARSMEDSMREDFRALGCQDPDLEPRATEHIPEMISHIATLLSMGLAYVDAGGSVWQDGSQGRPIESAPGRKADDLWSGSRVEPPPGKRGPRDFVLWKTAKPGEPSWASPWGAGRPGWHIECSAMSRKALGDTLDIHGGGEDLKSPHHECECAQSEPVTGAPLARKWLHNGFVVLPFENGEFEEMRNSSGNALNIKALLRQHPGEAIRAWALGAHYRQPLPYSEGGLAHARQRAWRWAAAKELALAAGSVASPSPDPQVSAAMDADFNTPLAFSRLDALSKAVRAAPSGPLGPELLSSLAHLGMGQALARDLEPRRAQLGIGAEKALAGLLMARAQARQDKNWTQADLIRIQLDELGFELSDAPSCPVAKPKELKG